MKTPHPILILAGCAALALTDAWRSHAAQVPAPPASSPPAGSGVLAPPDVTPPAALTQATPPEAPAAKAPAAAPPPAAETMPKPAAATEIVPLIVIDDVPLLDAVKNLARQAALNFQFDPRVTAMTNQPNVTIRFENVTAEDALLAVLDNHGLTLQHDVKKRISKITIKDPKAEEPLVSRVIQLKYSSPTNMMNLLKSTLSARSQVVPDTRTSQILVLATEKEQLLVDELILRLDTPTRQVLIEAQLWETTKNPQSVKGIDWSGTLENQRFSFGNGSIDPSASSANTISPGNSSTVTLPGGRTITTTEPFSTRTEVNQILGAGGLSVNTAQGFHPATAFLNADGLNAVLSFLNKDADTELVATPRAVTLDNQTASLNVSRAYPVYRITPGSANSPAGSEITWTNVGVILNVTPRIAANSNISLHVTPEVSDIAAIDRQVINGQTYTANIYGIRKVETHVMIPSGHTLVMGGLMNDRSFKGYTKVPILGDMPGVGLLFRKDEKKRDKSNLLIFVTPTIIEDADFQLSRSTGFLKTRLQPEHVDKPVSAWDSGKPYDWTKPTYKPDGPKPKEIKTGHR